ncbi:MAG: acyl-CoA/acyl-ACP dehydrogenase [Pirellulales bacterium]|nr:acyl-CoA/acyl-ACP dehydrogenase [Pirellulales bacterium]
MATSAMAIERMTPTKISSPDDPALAELCEQLAKLAPELDLSGDWPTRQLELCGQYGVYEWFIEPGWGGQGWSQEDVIRGYLALSSACLTTTFILTQRTGACGRIASSKNQGLKDLLLPNLVQGNCFATVGISHLTTSRRHLSRPVLRAERKSGGFLLEGYAPWVTGAAHAQHVVVGATIMLDDKSTEEQLLLAVPTDLPCVSAAEPAQLIGLMSSHTGELRFDRVFVADEWVLAGPVEDVMSQGVGAGTGGYQTSTLALGLARSAIEFLQQEARQRAGLDAPLDALSNEYEHLHNILQAVVHGEDDDSGEQLRQQANSLALRSAQAALATAKGTGYLLGHPAGRWCREALFFLVWSCPLPVVTANLCELAGISE